MDIQSKKIELVKTILAIENVNFIQKVADFVNKETTDFCNELSLSEQNESKEGINQLDQGKRIPFDECMKKIS